MTTMSYAGLLKAYIVMAQKGYCPYEWFAHVSKLNYPDFPLHETFYSNLKGDNISAVDFERSDIYVVAPH